METELPTLPRDVILRILSRCPIKTVLNLTHSCKFFRNLVKYDPLFPYNQFRIASAARQVKQVHVMTTSHVLSWDEDDLPVLSKISWDEDDLPVLSKISYSNTSSRWYLGECFHVAGSSHGIICLYQFGMGSNYAKVYLWNPTLNQTRALPDYLEDCSEKDFMGFGFDIQNQQHKFVRIRSSSPTVDVYNLWDDTWKSLTHNLSPQDCLTHEYPTISKSVELNGSLHWVSTNRSLIKFELSDERVSELKFPPDMPGKHLGVVKGCLSLLNIQNLHFLRRKFEIWSINEKPSDSNSEFSRTFEREPNLVHNTKLIELTTNGKVITQREAKIVSYDPETKKVVTLGPFDANNRYRSIDYVESLIYVWPSSKRIIPNYHK